MPPRPSRLSAAITVRDGRWAERRSTRRLELSSRQDDTLRSAVGLTRAGVRRVAGMHGCDEDMFVDSAEIVDFPIQLLHAASDAAHSAFFFIRASACSASAVARAVSSRSASVPAGGAV